MFLQLLFHVILLWSWLIDPAESVVAKANCTEKCGNITIPYPFGTQRSCYLDSVFQITCVEAENRTYPILSLTDQEVMEISVQGLIKVANPITFSNCGEGKDRNWTQYFGRTPFAYSSQENVFSSIACGAVGLMKSIRNESVVGGCLTICSNDDKDASSNRNSGINFTAVDQSCNGVDCCQTTLPLNLQSYSISFLDIDQKDNSASDSCRYAFVADQKWFSSTMRNISQIREMAEVPVVLEWGMYHSAADVFGESFRNVSGRFDQGSAASCEVFDFDSSSLMNGSRLECSCKPGFDGNPYLLRGCRDIDECSRPGPPICGYNVRCFNRVGGYVCSSNIPDIQNTAPTILIVIVSSLVAVLLLVGAWFLYKFMRKRKAEQQKQKNFKRNGGLLLQQQLSSGEVNVEKIKLFNSKELEKATEKFNVNRILGQGGQGTVYKGMLTDGKIVAVKRPKSTVEGDKLHEFINEVVILSQINHRNVVKLLGCCLETEVPLLVYEFIPNGTLSQYIHDANEEFPMTWETRLRIATETASALAYLHSSASVPIYHRDIKSVNILLDEKYKAKVADFGTSRSVSIDQTHVTTMVYGTFGYLDPEYFQSGQFTDKSDVYSFGVVLVELLTSQKPIISVTKSEKGGSLATCFMLSVEEDRLFDLVDAQVVKETERETIIAFASLAKSCLNLNGKRRPTMKEVSSVLEDMKKPAKSLNTQQNEVEEFARNDLVSVSWDLVSTSTWSSYDGTSSSSASHPLLTSKQ